MASTRANSRERILLAAAQVAREAGPGSLSLDAVAHRAGVSKGGLLYNFPSKAKLLQSMVEGHIAEMERDLESAVSNGESLLHAYVRLAANACEEKEAPASWIFSAVAEDPDFLEPVKLHRRRLLDRLKAEGTDPGPLLVAFFAMEGVLSMKLFDDNMLSPGELQLLVDSVLDLARRATP